MNCAVISGNVTRDPHVNRLQSGTAIVNFTVAVNETFKNREGVETKKANYLDCVIWTKHPENYERMLVKGTPVTVVGSLSHESWVGKDQVKKSVVRIKVESVAPINAPRDVSAGDGPTGAVNDKASPMSPDTGEQGATDGSEPLPF